MKKNIFSNIALIAVGLSIAWLFLELILRGVGFYGMSTGFEPVEYSSQYGWSLKKKYEYHAEDLEWKICFKTNQMGFRDSEHSFSNREAKKRVLLLGDSITEGFGIDQNKIWPQQLQKELGSTYEVINLGVRGYDIIQEYKLFIENGQKFHPQLIIQVLCDNDFGLGQESIMGQYKRFRPKYKIKDNSIVFLPKTPSKEINNKSSSSPLLFFIKKIGYHSASIVWMRQKILALISQNKPPLKEQTTYEDDYGKNYSMAVEIIYQRISRLAKIYSFQWVVVWVGVSPIPDKLKRYIEQSKIDLEILSLDKHSRFKYDKVHPNLKGNKEIAKQLYGLIRSTNLGHVS